MAISMSALFGASLSLLLVVANAGSMNTQQIRQTKLRYQKTFPTQPEAEDRAADQEAPTREDQLERQELQSAAQDSGVSQQHPIQMQQMGQQPQVAPVEVQQQQLLQAQMLQMQQMQKQLQEQQKELQRLQQVDRQKTQTQQVQQRQPPAQKPQQSLVENRAQVKSGAQALSKAELEGGLAPGVTRPKGWDQCLKFARFVKSQEVTGVEMVRVWRSTCEPAVQSGRATERYKLMCNSLSGVVEPYAAQIDYDVEQLCDSVLAVFHDVTAVDAKAR